MSSLIATVAFAIGVLGLFWLDRESKVKTSKALWLPVIWLLIVGSRPVSSWLGMGSGMDAAAEMAEGSPLDAAIFAALLATGIIALLLRWKRIGPCLKASWPLVLYFAYCLISLLWSDFADVGFKRWTKALGDLVMVLIVVTDPKPTMALKRFLARVGFILLPASFLLIKYYGTLGRAFDAWGELSITGVTTNKNLLGVINLVLSLGAAWRVITLLREKTEPHRGRHLLAQGTLLLMGIALFAETHSATSGACFTLGSGLMFATGLKSIGRRPATVHKLVLTVILAGGLLMALGMDAVVHAMGRKTDFTGRTAIWEKVIPLNPNPVVGAGFESFWLGSRLQKMWDAFPVFHPNEAHNGYLEVYLNLGYIGVGLIALILIHGYWSAVSAFRRDVAIGGMMLAYVAVSAIYSVTEAGFRLLDPIWIFLLLAVVSAGRVRVLAGTRATKPARSRSAQPPVIAAADARAALGRSG